MASRKPKIEEPQTETATIEQVEDTAQTGVDETVEPKNDEGTQPKIEEPQTETATVGEVVEKNIPEFADNILKCFPNEEKLYVNSHGGVFTSDTKPSETDGAILYRNPYYK